MTLIPRLQLFEWEDQPWFPAQWRDFVTDYLRYLQNHFGLWRPLADLLAEALQASGVRNVVDLCSGGGGPILALQQALAMKGMRVGFTLTDRYPNLDAFRETAARARDRITFVAEPVDAAAVPHHLRGFRTLFNAFHHFEPADAIAVLRAATRERQPVGVFEFPQRTFAALLFALIATPLIVIVLTPFMRPFSWSRLFWTYAIPVVPLLCWWDTLVSHCRAYTRDELVALGTRASADYDWTAGSLPIPGAGGCVTYLLGLPGDLQSSSSSFSKFPERKIPRKVGRITPCAPNS